MTPDPVQQVVGGEVPEGREGPQRVGHGLGPKPRQQRRGGGDEPHKRLRGEQRGGARRPLRGLELGEAVQGRGDVDLVEHVDRVGDGVEDLESF